MTIQTNYNPVYFSIALQVIATARVLPASKLKMELRKNFNIGDRIASAVVEDLLQTEFVQMHVVARMDKVEGGDDLLEQRTETEVASEMLLEYIPSRRS